MERKRTSSTSAATAETDLWAHHHAEYRDPHQIVSQWRQAGEIDPRLLEYTVRGDWWDVLARTELTLFITREYEHLAIALTVGRSRPHITYLHLPHPNGMCIDEKNSSLSIASTRNPNVVFEFAPCSESMTKEKLSGNQEGVLLPQRAQFFPGCLYIHDLARIGDDLYANAVGLNAVVRLPNRGNPELVWWPRCIDTKTGPRIDKNYLQLNSIAPGKSLAQSFFSASAAQPGRRRPGHLNFPVDRRGVIFAGATREVIGVGLTRPHSARLRNGEIWVDNSGYGQVGRIVNGKFESNFQLSGWTRGLYFHNDLAFVATSRVLPRYRHYAPGLDSEKCESGVHVLDLKTGRVLGSLLWPRGNQIFAIEGMPNRVTSGFPFVHESKSPIKDRIRLFSRGLAA